MATHSEANSCLLQHKACSHASTRHIHSHTHTHIHINTHAPAHTYTDNKSPPFLQHSNTIHTKTHKTQKHHFRFIFLAMFLYFSLTPSVSPCLSLSLSPSKAAEFIFYTEKTLLAQFDRDLQPVERVTLSFSTGNALKPRYKLRVLRIRLTPLHSSNRSGVTTLILNFDLSFYTMNGNRHPIVSTGFLCLGLLKYQLEVVGVVETKPFNIYYAVWQFIEFIICVCVLVPLQATVST